MATIAERVRGNWPDTEDLLSKEAAREYPVQKQRKIADAIELFWLEVLPTQTPPADVDALNVAVLQYIANQATIALIPLAKDAYMQGRLSENKTLNEGGTVGITGYNKLDELERLEARLLRDNRNLRKLAERAVLGTVSGDAVPTDVPVASKNTQAIIDPLARARQRG